CSPGMVPAVVVSARRTASTHPYLSTLLSFSHAQPASPSGSLHLNQAQIYRTHFSSCIKRTKVQRSDVAFHSVLIKYKRYSAMFSPVPYHPPESRPDGTYSRI